MGHSYRVVFLASLFVGVANLSFCFAEDSEANLPGDTKPAVAQIASPELDVIRKGAAMFVAAFNKQDADGVAALWTEDAEYIDDSGLTHGGRDAIKQFYAALFAENPNLKIEIVIDSLRLLSDNVAIEEGRAVVQPAPAGAPGVSNYTTIHIKKDGKWQMASVRDTWIETPVTRQEMADLAWLIGTWTAEEHGFITQSVYRWVADENFIERTYTTTNLDGTKTSGVQLIGWNPFTNRMQSWNFSPDGGYAVGNWTLNQGGWTAEMIGALGDGSPTSSINRLVRLDDNACVWQSVQRSVGGVPLPDTGEVVLKRAPTEPK